MRGRTPKYRFGLYGPHKSDRLDTCSISLRSDAAAKDARLRTEVIRKTKLVMRVGKQFRDIIVNEKYSGSSNSWFRASRGSSRRIRNFGGSDTLELLTTSCHAVPGNKAKDAMR